MMANRDFLLNKIYSAALLDGALSGVLSDIAARYPGLPISYQVQCAHVNSLYDHAIFNYGQGAIEKLCKTESANPFPPIALDCDVSDIVRTAGAISPEEVEKTDFFDEFLREYGNVNRATGIILHRQGTDAAFIAANFPKEFNENEEAEINDLWRFLRPHFQGAFKLLLELKKREADPSRFDFWLEQIPTSAFIVDASARVLQMNTMAADTVKTSTTLILSGAQQLSSGNSTAKDLVEKAITRASTTGLPVGPFSIPRQSPGSGLLFAMPIKQKVENHPSLEPFLPRTTTILVTYFSPSDLLPGTTEILMSALGITPRETALVQQLIAGHSLKEAAENLKISYNTARNQIASAHGKTGCRSQSDLIRVGTQILCRLPRHRP